MYGMCMCYRITFKFWHPQLFDSLSNFQYRLSHVYAINWSRMHVHLECPLKIGRDSSIIIILVILEEIRYIQLSGVHFSPTQSMHLYGAIT